jgi:hypothetical protein
MNHTRSQRRAPADRWIDVATTEKGGTPSMDSRSAAPRVQGPDAVEFVRFCYRRKRVGWPELYDEMCAVAGRALFRGFDGDDLAGIGIGLCLGDMPGLAALVQQVVAEDQERRRPVVVTIEPERDAASLDGHPAVPDEPRVAGPVRLAVASVGA